MKNLTCNSRTGDTNAALLRLPLPYLGLAKKLRNIYRAFASCAKKT
jgi:hypothetical protein